MATLIVKPEAGFGNRMRTLRGILSYAQNKNLSIKHDWVPNGSLCAFGFIQAIQECGFSYFFEDKIEAASGSEKIGLIFSEWDHNSGWFRFQNSSIIKFHCADKPVIIANETKVLDELLPQTGIHLFESSLDLCKTDTREKAYEIYQKYFQPRERFLSQLVLLPPIGLAISIRLGEFSQFFPDTEHNLLKIKEWLARFDCPVVLFTDELKSRSELRGALKHSIVPTFEATNPSIEDRTMLEFLVLSKANKIIGTKHSSFSYEASRFGNCEYETVEDNIRATVYLKIND